MHAPEPFDGYTLRASHVSPLIHCHAVLALRFLLLYHTAHHGLSLGLLDAIGCEDPYSSDAHVAKLYRICTLLRNINGRNRAVGVVSCQGSASLLCHVLHPASRLHKNAREAVRSAGKSPVGSSPSHRQSPNSLNGPREGFHVPGMHVQSLTTMHLTHAKVAHRHGTNKLEYGKQDSYDTSVVGRMSKRRCSPRSGRSTEFNMTLHSYDLAILPDHGVLESWG